MRIAKLMYHKWEEEPISGIARGYKGTFAIFFYGCNMRCVYCQNSKISHVVVGTNACGSPCRGELCDPQKIIYTPDELSDLMIKAEKDNCASVSFITGVLYVDKIAETIKLAKEKGLKIPIVYNSSGYEAVSQIKKFDGLIDIYLPDFKYYDNELGKEFSKVNNYPNVAKKCIAEMYRQVMGAKHCEILVVGAKLCEPAVVGAKLCKPAVVGATHCEPSLIVRHLVLPGHTENSKQVIKYLYDTYGDNICLSIMSQYTPMFENIGLSEFKELTRKLTKREYEKVINYAIDLGVKNALIQEGDVAMESFIPEF